MADCYIRKEQCSHLLSKKSHTTMTSSNCFENRLPAVASAVNFATQPDSVKQCVTAAKDLVVKI